MQVTMMRIRLPEPIHEQVRYDAERNDRSMNAEITQILKRHFGVSDPLRKKLVLKEIKQVSAS